MNSLATTPIVLSAAEEIVLRPTLADMMQLLCDIRSGGIVMTRALMQEFQSASHSAIPREISLHVRTLLNASASVRQMLLSKASTLEIFRCPIHIWALAAYYPMVKNITRLVGKPYAFVSDCQVLVVTPHYHVWTAESHGVDSVMPQFSKTVSLLPPLPD